MFWRDRNISPKKNHLTTASPIILFILYHMDFVFIYTLSCEECSVHHLKFNCEYGWGWTGQTRKMNRTFFRLIMMGGGGAWVWEVFQASSFVVPTPTLSISFLSFLAVYLSHPFHPWRGHVLPVGDPTCPSMPSVATQWRTTGRSCLSQGYSIGLKYS